MDNLNDIESQGNRQWNAPRALDRLQIAFGPTSATGPAAFQPTNQKNRQIRRVCRVLVGTTTNSCRVRAGSCRVLPGSCRVLPGPTHPPPPKIRASTQSFNLSLRQVA